MIIGDPTNYACDVCGKIGSGYTKQLPKGWSRLVWRPGILSPTKKSDQHYCSQECRNVAASMQSLT